MVRHFQDAPICRAGEAEISRPDLVAVLRASQRLAINDRHGARAHDRQGTSPCYGRTIRL